MSFEFKNMEPAGLVLVSPRVFPDARGFFVESYKKSEFAAAGIKENFVQDNHSRSGKGVLRGLHYQRAPYAQGKLVRCTAGAILDVAVDIRRGSATFGRWAAVELSNINAQMLYLPAGFAHGFIVLSGTAEIMYKCTCEYNPGADAGIIWNDPDIGVEWGIDDPVLSAKDSLHPRLKDAKL